jgi:hypothetical protein
VTPASPAPRRLLLLAAPGSLQALPLMRALARDWTLNTLLPGIPAAAPPGVLRQAARRAALVLHLAPDGGPALAPLPGLAEVYAPPAPAVCAPGPRERLDPGAWEALWRRERDLARRARLVVVPDEAAALVMRLVHGVPPARLRRVPPAALPAVLPALLDLALRLPPPDGTLHAGFTLALNDYPILERHTGGAVRVRHGLAALGRDTLLLSLGNAAAAAVVAPGLVQLSVPKGADQRAMEADLLTLGGSALEDIASALHAPDHAALAAVAADLGARAGVAVFEHCYLATLLDVLRGAAPELPVVYDAHNVEAALKRELLRGHPAEDAMCGFVATVEQRLVARAGLVLACSEADAEAFHADARQVVAMPHGVLPVAFSDAHAAPAHAPPRLGFLGSAHPPNLAAARFIVEKLAPALPEVRFELVGSVCAAVAAPGANVVLHGILDEAALAATLSGWTMALNPVESGGGASLKVTDYLAHGLPSLSTPHAARGFPALGQGPGLVLPLAGFLPAIRALLAAPGRLETMARSARDTAAAHGWPEVAAAARRAIAALPPRHGGGLWRPSAPLPPPPVPTPLPALLRQAPSARRSAAQRAALGLTGPFVVLLGEPTTPWPPPPEGCLAVHHDGRIARLLDADGRHRAVVLPLASLLLPPEPPCRGLWLAGAAEAAFPGSAALAEATGIPVRRMLQRMVKKPGLAYARPAGEET